MARPRHPAAAQRAYPRAARLNELLREVLAEALERLEDTDERLGMLTLTGVSCEPDLRHAVVFLASLSDGARAALEEHRRQLQAAVASQVRTRRVPALRFEADPAIEAARRVDEALRRAQVRVETWQGEHAASGAADPGSGAEKLEPGDAKGS